MYFLFLVCVFTVGFVTADDPIVKIKNGKIRGTELESRDGSTFLAFSGIPYAKPPINELRFKSPQPASNWDGVLNTTSPGASCIQYYSFMNPTEILVQGEEDCLFINVYTRELPSSSNKVKKPVLVFIHGGGFMIGNGSPEMAGPEIIMDRDVVLVAMNYRLGILGFLSTANKHLTGNYGLKDQALALKWVKENIQHFSGDSSKITIFGVSAGGASVHYQMLSPLTKGLFERAYAASGTALCSWAYVNNDLAQTNAKKLARLVECPDTLDQKMVDCFMKKDAKELVEKVPEFLVGSGIMSPITPFGPTAELEGGDERFLPDIPYEIIRQGKVHDVPFMAGFTSNEGLMFVLMSLMNPSTAEKFQNEFDTLLPPMLDYAHATDDVQAVTERIKKYYFGHDHENVLKKNFNEESMLKMMSELFSDRLFVHGIYEAVELQLQSGLVSSPIYTSQLSQPMLGPNFISMMAGGRNLNHLGVPHGGDIAFIFKFGGMPISFTEEDEIMSRTILNQLIAFAETGNPNYEGSTHHWSPTTRNFEFLDLNLKSSMKSTFPHPRMEFWRSLPITTGGKKHIEKRKDEL